MISVIQNLPELLLLLLLMLLLLLLFSCSKIKYSVHIIIGTV